MSCVRCGDIIDKNELVCDKCGLRFTVVRADGTTVYINQSPTPIKKKKFRFGWLIALVSVISVVTALLFGGILLSSGILMGILTIIPRTSYSQGIPRWTTQFDKTDWYFPEFAHLGEQAVLNKELYYDPKTIPSLGAGPDDVFGYQGRFTELRYIPGSYHGDLRGTLQYWQMGRHFNNLPVLNSSFVQGSTQCDAFAMHDVAQGDIDPFIAQIKVFVKAVRPLPKYAVPTL